MFNIVQVEKSIGSGNAGDPETAEWLKAWHAAGRPWPWFVKRSFRTIQEIEGKSAPAKKAPPINDHLLSEDFRRKFDSGELNIAALSVICPSCGSIAKSARLIMKNGVTIGICVNCKKELPNLAITLRYYCGRVLADANVITSAFLSKDLQASQFFENVTILLGPVVRTETDTPGGKKELQRLGAFFVYIGRIRLGETGSLLEGRATDSLSRDEAIQRARVENNAILITADKGMMGSAQAKGLFVLEL